MNMRILSGMPLEKALTPGALPNHPAEGTARKKRAKKAAARREGH